MRRLLTITAVWACVWACASSCTLLDAPDRKLTTLVGVQDGAAGDMASIARPLIGVDLVGGENRFGLVGVLGIQVSTGNFGSLNAGDVSTNATAVGLSTGLRLTTRSWERTFRPFWGVGLAAQYMSIELPGGDKDDSGVGGYIEAGLEVGSFSLRWRRVGAMDLDYGVDGGGNLALDQFLFGWSTGF